MVRRKQRTGGGMNGERERRGGEEEMDAGSINRQRGGREVERARGRGGREGEERGEEREGGRRRERGREGDREGEC